MNILGQLKRDESCSLTPYQDSVGVWTVGYGHNCQATPISQQVADQMLADDLERVRQGVCKAWPWVGKLDDARYGVILNMAYNLGVSGLGGFVHFLAAMKAGNWQAAANEMQDSKWWGQVGERAKRLQQQVLTGEWY